MDKRKIGAVVGVVGVTGAIAAIPLIDIDRSTADHMTKDLTNQYKNIQDQAKEDDQLSQEVNVVEEKVFDPVQNVEYIVQKEEPVESREEEVVELPSEESQSSSVELALEESRASSQTAIEEEVPEETTDLANASEKGDVLDPLSGVKDQDASTPEVELAFKKEEKTEEKKEEEEAREFRGIVTVDALNVRTGAGSNYEIIDILSKDDLVIGQLKDGWIAFGEGDDLSYINAEFVDELTPAGFDQMIARQKTLREEAEARKKAEEEEAKKKAEEEAAKKKAEEEKAKEEAAKKESAKKEDKKKEEELKEKSGAAYSGFVSVSTANVRKGPSNSADIIGVASINYPVQGEEVSLGWIKINYQGQTAYIHKNVLSFEKTKVEEKKAPETKNNNSDKQEAQPSTDVSGYTTADSLFVRQGPGTGYDSIGYLHRNDPIQGKDLKNGWIQINFNGSVGYISSKFFSTEKQSAPQVEEKAPSQNQGSNQAGQGTVDQIINLAKQQLGKPYIYGAAGPNSFDCSGLTSWLYRSFGYTIQRGAAAQTSNGYSVSKANLRPGDLVFFSNESSGGRVGHVGIYIGDGQIIHASTPQLGVRTDSLNSSWFINHYMGARRIIN